MRTIYVKVLLKPPVQLAPPAWPPTRLAKGKPMPPRPADPAPAPPVYEVRTVQAEDLGHACRAAEAMQDVLAVITTSLKPIS